MVHWGHVEAMRALHEAGWFTSSQCSGFGCGTYEDSLFQAALVGVSQTGVTTPLDLLLLWAESDATRAEMIAKTVGEEDYTFFESVVRCGDANLLRWVGDQAQACGLDVDALVADPSNNLPLLALLDPPSPPPDYLYRRKAGVVDMLLEWKLDAGRMEAHPRAVARKRSVPLLLQLETHGLCLRSRKLIAAIAREGWADGVRFLITERDGSPNAKHEETPLCSTLQGYDGRERHIGANEYVDTMRGLRDLGAVPDGHAVYEALTTPLFAELAAWGSEWLKGCLPETPLHFATKGGDVDDDVIELLLEHGADLEVKDPPGQTPIDGAKKAGHTERVRILKRWAEKRAAALEA